MSEQAGVEATTALPTVAGAQPRFATVRRGYEPEQVEAALNQAQARLDEATRRYAAAENALGAARREAATHRAEAERLREQLTGRPSPPELSGRIGRILALAEEEAEAIRDEAREQARVTRGQAAAELTELQRRRAEVAAELTRVREQLGTLLAD